MKILFIAHDSFRAGAQLFLLRLLKWLRNNSKHEFAVLLKTDGDLAKDFLDFGNVYVWRENNSFRSKLGRKIYRKQIINSINSFAPDLVYSNTIVNGAILNELSFLNKPVLTHVHELEYWIGIAGEKNMEYNIKYTNEFVAVSEAVKNNLCENHGIDASKISVINGFVESLNTDSDVKSLHEFLDLDKKSILIGASGGESWRKGKDLFVPLAIEFFKQNGKANDVHFVWIGGETSYELKHDLDNCGHSDRIHFVKHLENAQQYFGSLYLFLMMSREDSFPLVNIEAASHGVPIGCFNGAGGTPEFINGTAGFVVPYLDISSMVAKVTEFVNDVPLRNSIGENARQESRKYDVDIIANKILKRLEGIVNN